jgi:hypothetical protein
VKRAIFWNALSFISAMILIGLSSSNKRNRPEQKEEAARRAQYVSERENGKVPIVAIAAPQQWHADEKSHRSKERKYWGATILLTLAAAVGAGATAWFTFGTWREAGRQADLTEKALIEVQRAFVGISELNWEQVTEEGKTKWRVRPVIKNTGTTAVVRASLVLVSPQNAWLLKERYKDIAPYNVGAPPDPDELRGSERANALIQSGISIGPQGTISPALITHEFPAGDDRTYNSGIFIYGSLLYEDIFSRLHVSKFCFAISAGGRAMKGLWPAHILCSHWNCTDADCQGDKQAYEADLLAKIRSEEEANLKAQQQFQRLEELKKKMLSPPQ